ncbi:hypothetical protein ABER99_20450 [Paenibacillus glucanolyticus]|uniref:Uncharacterized protein n=1 Tax=Paenibacillus glucanolyticus TaxID=59843 RepID=A0A163GHE7_9BACL|nr:hypothetical protein [Paenibacillus glucanolyticus]KZS44974.1 hypothetical protein AWU65_03060 [Paenibacillus glucanolyticus]OMF64813.1 hypothetical protein BK142_31450 [Paenibacillus glucanolyticus]
MSKSIKPEVMTRKLAALRKTKARYINANKMQYAPDDNVEFDFMMHLYLMLGAYESDIIQIKQNAAGVLNTPQSDAEKRISLLLNEAGFTAMELARLESFDLLNQRSLLIRDIHRLMKVCMVVTARTEVVI